jgi:predicted MFS family arabinose efflux permease
VPVSFSSRLTVGWLTLFVVGTDLFVISPLLPAIAAAYGVDLPVAGSSVTAFSVAYMLAAPLLGHIADRLGRRRMLGGCLVAFAAANLSTAFAGSFAVLVVARVVAGATAAGVSPAVYALVGEWAPAGRRATWLAVAVSGLLTSLSIGAPLGALFGAAWSWRGVFAVLSVLSLLLAVANLAAWPRDRRSGGATDARHDAPHAGELARRLLPTIVWSTALYAVYTYLGAGLADLGYAPAAVARVIAFYGGGAIAGALAGGRLADRLGSGAAMRISLVGLGLSFVVLVPAVGHGMLLAVLLGVASALAQLFFPAQQAALAADFPGLRATVLAWNNSALFLGIALGSLLGGQAVVWGGLGANLALSAGLALAGACLTGARPRAAAASAARVDGVPHLASQGLTRR